MRFGLIANLKRIGAGESINVVMDWAAQTGHQVILCDELEPAVSRKATFVPRSELAAQVDVLITMGGDGTILAAVRAVGSLGTPVLGVNLGSLGFLAQQTPERLMPTLEAVAAGAYHVEERMMLQVKVEGHAPLPAPFALNDMVLDNGPVSRVLEVSLKVNDEEVVTYLADGLIISTPTGSTAYNLAVGGPIVHPGLDAMIAAPISPFSLTTRPMIIRGEDRVELRALTEQRTALLTLDGQVGVRVYRNEAVTISRADFRSRFIVFPENSYYELLRSKLHWGMPPYRRTR